VVEDLNGIIPCILDGGPTRIGLESTVIDLSGLEPVILRPGGISLEEIQAVLPNARHAQANDDRSISPGTKYRHYAPKAKVMIVDRKLNPEVSIDYSYQGNKVGWIGESAPTGVHHLIFPNDANFYARYYFAALRDLDQPARGQGLDRAAHRLAAHIQLRGQFAFARHRIARAQQARDDHTGEPIRDLLAHRALRDGGLQQGEAVMHGGKPNAVPRRRSTGLVTGPVDKRAAPRPTSAQQAV
jgi:hypothetical protein